MKFGNFEITFSRRATQTVTKVVEAAPIEKGFGTVLDMVMNWFMSRKQVTDPFSQSPSVYKAIKAISDNAPQAEIAFYLTSTNEETRDENLERLLYKPNYYQNSHDFIENLAGDFAYYGEIFIHKTKSLGQLAGTRNLPAELIPLCPKDVETIIDKNTGRLTSWKHKQQIIPLEEVIHVKTYNVNDPFRGACPYKIIDGEIQLDYKSMQYNLRFFENDATPSFMLSTEKNLTEDQRKRLIKWSEERSKGVDNAHKVNVFDGGLKAEVLARSHKDMEFLDQRRYAREEILGTFRTPKAILNITEDLNYSTFTGQMKIFWVYTLVPILRKLEEGISQGLVDPYNPKIYFAFKLDNVPAFQEDFSEKVKTGAALWAMGFTADEINQKLNLGFDEAEWRKHWWIGFGQVPADVALEEAQNPPDPAQDEEEDPKADKGAKNQDIRALKVWKGFLAKQAPLEKQLQGRIRKHFLALRGEVLHAVGEGKAGQLDAMINWRSKDEDLKKSTKPVLKKAIEDGVDIGKDLIGKKSALDDVIGQRIEELLTVRADKIVGINRTLQKQIRRSLEAGISAGQSINDLADGIREVFNTATARALTISRTETAGAVNGGTDIYYRESGVDKKRWVTAGDENVRESHRQIDGESVGVDSRFSNGLNYPCDQEGEAAEVINCRCTLIPIL